MKKIKYALIGTVSGVLSGLFGAGGGAILIVALERFLGLSTHEAHATTVAVVLPMAVVSAVIYLTQHASSINYLGVVLVSIGGLAGGYIGATYFKKLSGKVLHWVFGVFMMIAGIRMVL